MSREIRPANDNGNLVTFRSPAAPVYEDVDLDTLCSDPEYVATSEMFETAADSPLTSGVALGIDHEGVFNLFNAEGMSAGDILLMLERAKRFVLDYAEGVLMPEDWDEDADIE